MTGCPTTRRRRVVDQRQHLLGNGSPQFGPRSDVQKIGSPDFLVVTEAGWRLRCRSGSSPRAWGTHLRGKSGGHILRFIPTGVGNAPYRYYTTLRIAVHPHGRGERADWTDFMKTMRGSSPRAWGTRSPHTSALERSRFIPTGVGNANSPSKVSRPAAVHPHGRGERERAAHCQLCENGSSPRAWGTLFSAPGVEHGRTVHPHGRGERGAGRRSCSQAIRFIPTGVGNAGCTSGRN